MNFSRFLSPHVFMAFGIWLITSMFYAFQFFVRSSLNPLSPQLMESFAIDSKSLGLLAAMYYVPYALLQIPVGTLLDMFGPKKMLRFGTCVCCLGVFVFGFSHHFYVALLGRFLIGIGASVSFIGAIRANTLWISRSYLAFAIGSLTAMGKIFGGAFSLRFLEPLMTSMPEVHMAPWHYAILSIGCWGTFLAALIWLLVKNGPKDEFVPSSSFVFSEILKNFKETAKNPTLWMIGLYGYALYLSLSVFGDTYSINFLTQKLKISREQSSSLSSMLLVGSAVGAPLFSYLSDYLKRRKTILILCAFGTLLTSSLIFFMPPLSKELSKWMLFLMGFFAGGQSLIFIVAVESSHERRAGMALGIVNGILMAGGALQNPLVGSLLKMNWSGHHQAGIPIYSLFSYEVAFASMTFFFVLAAIIGIFIGETHPDAPSKRKIYRQRFGE